MQEIDKRIMVLINSQGVVSKSYISRMLHRVDKDVRDKAVNRLIRKGLIDYRQPVTRATGVKPTYYNLSSEGINEYKRLVENGEIE